jgi:YD repeat-containing protein
MKYTTIVTVLGLLASASSAFAITPGWAPAVTLALTCTYQEGGFTVKDEEGETWFTDVKYANKYDKDGNLISQTTEWKGVQKTYRFGNKELLEVLNDEGYLDGTTVGWSIVNVTDPDDCCSDGFFDCYAIKKGQAPVLLDEFTMEVGMEVLSCYAKESTTYNTDGEVTKHSYSDAGSGKGEVSFSLWGIDAKGLATYSYKYTTGVLGTGEEAVEYETYLAGAVKLANIIGHSDMEEELVEGTISIAAGKIIDLETIGW